MRATRTRRPTTEQRQRWSDPDGKRNYRVCDYFCRQTYEAPDSLGVAGRHILGPAILALVKASTLPNFHGMQMIEIMESTERAATTLMEAGVRFRYSVFA